MDPIVPPLRSYWQSWRLGVWAIGLSVLSVFVQLELFIKKEGGGHLLVAVLAGSVFRLFFIALVLCRLYVTPEPAPGTSGFENGHGFKGAFVQCLAILGFVYHGLFFFDFLSTWVWVGLITSALWIVWIYGMAVREIAHCEQLKKLRNSKGRDPEMP